MKIASDGFNWKSGDLKNIFEFPVTAYKKENGFLALISYNYNTNNLLICSKSTNTGDYVDMIKEQINKLPLEKYNLLASLLKENNYTMVCECINQDKDPHIIKYANNQLIVLDLIYNDWEYKKASYQYVKNFANNLGLQHKIAEHVFNTWEELYAFKKLQDESYDIQHEGWVFEDANGFMVKYKTRFYKFWKQMRAVKERLQQGNNVKKIFTTENEVRVFNILKSIEPDRLKEMSIIDIEDIFYNQYPEFKK